LRPIGTSSVESLQRTFYPARVSGVKLARGRSIYPCVSPDQITRNAAAIAGAVKMLEREIASFQEQLSVSASTDETRRQISDYLTELHFHFRTLSIRADTLESETRALLGTHTAA
jgi:hypothetical protein